MAAIVKANARLTNGGMVVLRRSYSTSDDGTFAYEADYCCLAQFAVNHVTKFKTQSFPPTPEPAEITKYKLVSRPKLYDFQTATVNGLTYFYAKYSTGSLEAAEVIVTESSEQRSFSKTVAASVTIEGAVTAEDGSTSGQTINGQTTISFDYISITRTNESKSPTGAGTPVGSVSGPFNYSSSQIAGLDVANQGSFYSATTVLSTRISRSTRGTYLYSTSSTGIYV